MSEHREGFSLWRLLLRWLINAAAIWVAFEVVPGIEPLNNSVEAILVIALIFGLVNAIIRPIIAFFTCPLIILTLGLGTLIINAGMFALAGAIGRQFGFGFTLDGFWPAFWGALVVSIVSWLLSILLGGGRRRGHVEE